MKQLATLVNKIPIIAKTSPNKTWKHVYNSSMHWNVTENNFQPSQHIYKGIICTGNLKQTKKLLQISTLNLCTDGKMNAIMKLPNWTFAIFPYSKIKSWIALFITRACAQSALNRLWGSPWHFTLTVFEMQKYKYNINEIFDKLQ